MPGTVLRFGYSAFLLLKNCALNRLRPPIIILLYHRVAALASDPHLLAVAPHNFRCHMEFLKDNFPVIRFEDNWSKVKEPSVVITFDDGYADNVLEAMPILEDVGLPATFFISTGVIGTQREFWWDELECVILDNQRFPDHFDLVDSRYGMSWNITNAVERREMFHAMFLLMKKVDVHTREDWLKQLREWACMDNVYRVVNRPMTIDELHDLAKSKWVTIGAHTVTHTSLSSLSFERQTEEIIASKEWLEKQLGREILVFSYPFGGRNDYDHRSVRICKEAGFTKAAVNLRGPAHRGDCQYQLPRQLVRDWPIEVFQKKMGWFWLL